MADPELLLPTNQAVEERSGSHRNRSAMRIGVRGLVVGGFAGVAWLLAAGAAQAAHAEMRSGDTVGELSVVNLVNALGNGSVEDGQTSLLMPAAQGLGTRSVPGAPSTIGELLAPLDWANAVVLPSATAAQATPIADLLSVDRPDATVVGDPHATTDGTAATAVTATASGGVSHTRAGTVAGPAGATELLGTVAGLVTPLGKSDAPTGPTGLLALPTRAVAPVLAPLDVVLRPATDVLHSLTAPVAAVLEPVTRAVAGGNTRPAAPAEDPVLRPTGGDVVGRGADSGPASTALTGRAGGTGGTISTFSVRRFVGTEWRATGTPDARPGSDLPDRTHPAPLRAHLGTGPGFPANGWGSPTEGGAPATVPSSVVGGTVAFHQLPMTADVAVLRHDAEAPTVSPD
jgi:hypothetical protein